MRLISSFTESRILNELKQKIADLVLLSDKQHEDLKGYSNVANNMHKRIHELQDESKKLKEENKILLREKSQLAELNEKQRQDLNSYPEITKALYAEIDMRKSESEKLRNQIELMRAEKEKIKEDLKISESFNKSLLKEMKCIYEKEEKQNEVEVER